MDAPASPLILTKLCVPTTRLRTVARSGLVRRLMPEPGTGLVLVCAPAGYGKTTLLVAWCRDLLQAGIAVAWYALDASDDASGPFGSYLVASLIQALGPLPELERAAQVLRASPEVDLQRLMPAVINAVVASDRRCVLILDDYHLVGAPAVHAAVAFLLEHIPGNLHIVISSRSDPPLPLARLRARGQLLEIRSAELRFSADETARFLNEVMHLDLPAETITTLEARTEGWVVGLQLAALSLAGRSDKDGFIAAFAGSHRYLVEYLLEEVFNRQAEEVRAFLLATSTLERMSVPLCDAICGIDAGSETMLKRLEKDNLFVIAIDDQGEWYRYHHLFRDFLYVWLQKTHPGRAAELHRQASEWCAAHGLLREAVQQAFQTGDWDYAAAVVEQHSFTMLVHSEISTIYEWCAAFPEAVLQQHPVLCILQCWALVFSFRQQYQDRVKERLQQVERTLAALDDERARRELSEHAAVVRTFLSMAPDSRADPRPQLAAAQDMLAYYPEGDAAQLSALLTTGYCHMALHDVQAASRAVEMAQQVARSGHLYFGVAESTFNLARLVHSQGQLQRAAELCRQGQADISALLAHAERELPAVGCLDIALGAILLEQDKLEEAGRRLLHGLGLIGPGMPPYYLMAACVALFRLYEIQGRPAEALACLVRLEDTWPDIAFCTQGLRAWHALRTAPDERATLANAAAWCQAFSASVGADIPPAGLGPFGAADAYYLAGLAWVRARVALGEVQAARPYLERQLALAAANGLADRVIELSLLEALAGQAAGRNDLAWAALERALAAAQPAGYVRTFDRDPALTRLLGAAARQDLGGGKYDAYLERILAAIGAPGVPGQEGHPVRLFDLPSGERLSERELEVLRLMARGASNQEIAGQLVISVGTVKSHINHILAKLDAHNRTEAVAQARAAGLLEI